MTTDKEELRKEFVSKFCFTTSLGNITLNVLDPLKYVDWFYSKLEAKDNEIEELKSDKERLTKACNYIQSSRNELDQQITDLKAEIERIKGGGITINAFGLKTRTWTYDTKRGYGCAECCNGDRCDEDCTAKYKGNRKNCPHCKGAGWIPEADIVNT